MRSLVLIILLFASMVPIQVQSANDFSGSTLVLSDNVVGSKQQVNVVIFVRNSTNSFIADAGVVLTVTSGVFSSVSTTAQITNPTTITGFTNSTGYLEATWIAPEVNTTFSEITADFQAEISVNSDITYLGDSVLVKVLADQIANSALEVPSTVASGDEFEIKVRVLASDNTPVSGMSVDVGVSDGEAVTPASGDSGEDGYYIVKWKAPTVTMETPNITLDIIAVIVASPSVNITLRGTSEVIIPPNVSLGLILPSALEINEGEETTFSVRGVFNSSEPAVGADMVIEAADGTFDSGVTSLYMQTNSSGYVSFNWTAPEVLDENTLVTEIVVTSTFIDMNVTGVITITVLPIFAEMNISLISSSESFKQTEAVTLTVEVMNENTGQPLKGASVFLTTEFGFFNESGTNAVNILTDSSGKATTVLNLTEAILVKTIQDVYIFANASLLKFHTTSTNITLLVEKVIFKQVNVEISISSPNNPVRVGDEVEFVITVSEGESPLVNITVEMSADAGSFTTGDMIVRSRTDSSGKVKFTWSTTGMESLVSPTNVTFSLNVYVENFNGIDDLTLLITNPNSTSSTPVTPGSTDQTNGAVIAIVVILMAGISTSVVYLWKKKI